MKEQQLLSKKWTDSKFIAPFKNPIIQYVLFGAVLIILQFSGILSSSQMRAIGITIIYSIAAMGFCLLLGYSGQASLGTAGMMGLGSYIAYYFLIKTALPFTLIIIIVMLASLAVGVVVGFISLRIQGIFLAIITLGLSEILVSLFIALPEWTNGINGARLTNFPELFLRFVETNREVMFCVCVVALVLLMCMTHNLIKSPTGRAMLAMKNSTTAAQAYGIGLLKFRLLAFVLSTMYAAVAGVLYLSYFRASYPSTWSLALSLNILGAIILGGTKSIWGAVGGAFLIYGIDGLILQNIKLFNQNPTLISLLIGVIIILVVMFFPGGIPQMIKEAVAAIKRGAKKRKEKTT